MVLAVVFIVPPLFKLFLPLIVAWLIAMLANPLVRFLENKIKIMRKHGTVIVIVVVLALICAAIYGIICFTAVQVSSLVGELPELYQSVVNNLQSAMSSLHDKFNIIPADIQSMFGKRNMQLNEYILTALKSLKSSPVSTVGNVASSLIDFFVLLILTLMMTYFFVADHDSIKEAVEKHTPDSIKKGWQMVKDIIVKAIGGYLKACFQIMIVIFAILFIIFLLMGQKYAALIAFITAFLDFLPFVGTGTVLTNMKPMHATVAILTAMSTWNDVTTPLVILSGTDHNTLPIAQLNFQSQFGTNYNLAFASYLLALLPILLFYVVCQKQIMNGVVNGAVK